MVNNSKVNNQIWPKFEPVGAFTPVLITCKFDKDPIKGDWDIIFSPLKGMLLKNECDFMPVLVSCKFDEDWLHSNWEDGDTIFPIQCQWECSRTNNSVVKSLTRPKFKFIQDFMHVLITCKFDKDWIKADWENVGTQFCPLYVNGSFLLPCFDPICPKT